MSKNSRPFTYFLTRAYGLWFVAVFACTAIFTLGLVAVMPGQDNRRRLARGSARLLFRLTGAWPVVRGLDQLPTQPAVVVANHASYLDGILLTAVLPHRFQFVSSEKSPRFHWFISFYDGSELILSSDSMQKRGQLTRGASCKPPRMGAHWYFFQRGHSAVSLVCAAFTKVHL